LCSLPHSTAKTRGCTDIHSPLVYSAPYHHTLCYLARLHLHHPHALQIYHYINQYPSHPTSTWPPPFYHSPNLPHQQHPTTVLPPALNAFYGKTLKRDEQECLPTHRRRYSVNTSPHPAQGGEDNHARGTYLFRTAMNAPCLPSPSPSCHTFNHTLSHYCDSPEHEKPLLAPIPTSPFLTWGDPPGLCIPTWQAARCKSGETPTSHSACPGEPMGMVTHEQVLRACLERVLSAGCVVLDSQAAQTTQRNPREEMREKERGRRSDEVRDEVDGWPWREREYDSPSVRFFLFRLVFFSVYHVRTMNIAGSNSTTLDLSFKHHPQPISTTYPISNTCQESEQDGPCPPSHFFFYHGVTKAERNGAHTPSCTPLNKAPLTEQLLPVPEHARLLSRPPTNTLISFQL